MTLPHIRLFDEKGAWLEPPSEVLAMLDEPTRARLDAVRDAYHTLKDNEAAEKVSLDAVQDALQGVADAQAYRNKYHPPMTQHDLWIENFGNAEQRAALAARMGRV